MNITYFKYSGYYNDMYEFDVDNMSFNRLSNGYFSLWSPSGELISKMGITFNSYNFFEI